MKCDFTDDSCANGKRQPILYSFASDKTHGQKTLKRPIINFYKKINKHFWIVFYVGDDKSNRVDFIGGTLTFTLVVILIRINSNFNISTMFSRKSEIYCNIYEKLLLFL